MYTHTPQTLNSVSFFILPQSMTFFFFIAGIQNNIVVRNLDSVSTLVWLFNFFPDWGQLGISVPHLCVDRCPLQPVGSWDPWTRSAALWEKLWLLPALSYSPTPTVKWYRAQEKSRSISSLCPIILLLHTFYLTSNLHHLSWSHFFKSDLTFFFY